MSFTFTIINNKLCNLEANLRLILANLDEFSEVMIASEPLVKIINKTF